MGITFALVAALLSALAYLPLTERAPTPLRSLVKALPLTFFTLMAWIWQTPLLLVLALALSALGDVLLSYPGDRPLVRGMIAFGLGHLCYIGLFAPEFQAAALLPVAVLVALAVSTEAWLAPHAGRLRWPVRIYVLIITVMCIMALGLWPVRPLVTAGVALFLLSDLLIGIKLFRTPPRPERLRALSWALWVFYVAGQLLILFAYQPHAGLVLQG
ncbi:lysoplasmalogenase [Celeribacter indicus]|uniref:YhhN-like protein n=1 Tax=Celeribacter indicus TaxID=1208324 RepID=A0A0B5DXP7_9RHOB|nr:lysoplasmalogenase [Celeribacter indicus]AJE48208.1 hypothetical protein P73_3493 [Celeribacter indicus]SDW69497.1 Uncharacterized membrane protein YhhN [Celeribacter indicus]